VQLADGTAIDLSRASHFEWSIGARHPLTVGLAIEDTGGRCVLRIDGREVGRFGVSQAFHSDPDARPPRDVAARPV
jgi:hypothetical protein